jgi:cytochrome c553
MAGNVARWIGIGLGSVVGLAVLAAGGVYAASESRLNKPYDVDPGDLTIRSDAASIERGRHFAVAIAKCADCHGPDLGGKRVIDDAGLGRIIGPNLTSGNGGIGKTYTDKDWVRALRHGIAADGRPLVFMPADELSGLSDQDTADLIAYVKSVPPVDSDLPMSSIGPVGRMLMVSGALPLLAAERIDHKATHPPSQLAKVDADYGKYLAQAGGCMGCHGPGLSGGQVPGTPPGDPNFPPATNLTSGGPVGKWSEADFFKALRTGTRPDGTTLHPFMPWKAAAQMTDTEMQAVWTYIQSVPAKEAGNR